MNSKWLLVMAAVMVIFVAGLKAILMTLVEVKCHVLAICTNTAILAHDSSFQGYQRYYHLPCTFLHPPYQNR